MYTCMQCVIQGLPSHHYEVHVQYHDKYSDDVTTNQATEQKNYILEHTDTCPNGHARPSSPISVKKEEAEQLKGTKGIRRA